MSSEGFWRTSKIADRISDDLVVTLNGSKYQLIGLIDSKAARDVGKHFTMFYCLSRLILAWLKYCPIRGIIELMCSSNCVNNESQITICSVLWQVFQEK